MKKFLVFVMFVVYGNCFSVGNDELIYSTQCAYDKLIQSNGVVSIEVYSSVVESIINAISTLKKACSSQTSVDCCCVAENNFGSNCDLFLSELWELLDGDFSKKVNVPLRLKSELVNKVKNDLDRASIDMLGY